MKTTRINTTSGPKALRLFAVGSLALCLGWIAVSCSSYETRVNHSDPGLIQRGAVTFYSGQPLDGIVETRIEHAGITRFTPFRDGLIHGTEEERYDNGEIAATGEYRLGIKVGAHSGWYPDGRRRYVYEYRVGRYHGELREWYPSGELRSYARYNRGRAVGTRAWCENGRVYRNYVFVDGTPRGFASTEVCQRGAGPV
jgi:antitoxin component YwqK of YwqJK toxin-antitoxin module